MRYGENLVPNVKKDKTLKKKKKVTKREYAGRMIHVIIDGFPFFEEKRHEESFVGCSSPHDGFVWSGGGEQKTPERGR